MKILRLKQVMDMTGLARSTIYKLIAEGKFPHQIELTERSCGWVLSEVERWIMARIEAREVDLL